MFSNIKTLRRLATGRFSKSQIRPTYWTIQKRLNQFFRLYRNAEGAFAAHVLRDAFRFATRRVKPVRGRAPEHARAAMEWIGLAQDATPDDGVSYGYFPGMYPDGWGPSYPETTGYIIPSMIEYAARYNYPGAAERALRMARWEMQVQMPNGAVQGGPLCPPGKQTPAIFNTGMVLQGYTAAYRFTRDSAFLNAGRRAADFLLGDLGSGYHFRSHGEYVAQNQKKTYNCLCAWALFRFGEDSGESRYRDAAVNVTQAAIREQRDNGWIANNCLDMPHCPLTHTIGYALQGILEVGTLSGHGEFLRHVTRTVDSLLGNLRSDGFLPGRFFEDWHPASLSSCLTGSAQLAIVCFRLFQETDNAVYRAAGDRLLNLLKGLQTLDSAMPGVNGALPGSFPVLGAYMYLGYPNWATKYLLDALMLQDQLDTSHD
jgi:hypothetical protein